MRCRVVLPGHEDLTVTLQAFKQFPICDLQPLASNEVRVLIE